MTHFIAVLSSIPRLSHHLRLHLPNGIISDVPAELKDGLPILKKAEILVADADLLIPYIDHLSSVKWIQSTWAGQDKIIPYLKNKEINFTFTRFSDKSFGFAMSEYAIAQIVNFERDQRQQYKNQENALWTKNSKIGDHRLICDLNIGILGIGNIGRVIAQNLKSLGATVWGMSRRAPTEQLDYIDHHRTTENLVDILKNCDYIINVLPTTENTTGLLNGDVLSNCQDKGTVFMNIGRATIIQEDDLINALEKKWISGAILDVFNTEPLPKESKLWNLSQVTISPHNAGVTRPQDVARLFAENYKKYINGETLLNIFNWQHGY